MAGAPQLEQSVRWREQYVSAALNKKLAGVLAPGVYKGFDVEPSTILKHVKITNGQEEISTAIVERGGYSITVNMTAEGEVEIPAAGTWYIVIEAYYQPNAEGYQQIVAKQLADVKSHHVILAKVEVSNVGARIQASQIDTTYRNVSYDAQILMLQTDVARLGTVAVRLSTRLTRMELKDAGWTPPPRQSLSTDVVVEVAG